MAFLHSRQWSYSNLICATEGIPCGRSDSHQVEIALVIITSAAHQRPVSATLGQPDPPKSRISGRRLVHRNWLNSRFSLFSTGLSSTVPSALLMTRSATRLW